MTGWDVDRYSKRSARLVRGSESLTISRPKRFGIAQFIFDRMCVGCIVENWLVDYLRAARLAVSA